MPDRLKLSRPLQASTLDCSQGGSRAQVLTAAQPSGPAPAGDAPSVMIISLQQALQFEAGGHSCPLHLGCCVEDVLAVLEPFSLGRLVSNLGALSELHPAAQKWISDMPVWDGETHLRKLEIYTDGSFQPLTVEAAWATVVTGMTSNTTFFVGFHAGRLHSDDFSC